MNENDFLYARQETMPEDFGKDLWQQLQEQDKKPQPKKAIWTVAVASLLTAIMGIALVLSRVPGIATLMVAPSVPIPSFTQHGLITSENIDQLQPFARLGNGTMTGMHMMPDGEHLLVTATTGLYLHDAHDLSAEPEQIYEGSIGYYSDIDDKGNLYGVVESITAPPADVIIYTQGAYAPQAQDITVARWNGTTGERMDILYLDSLVSQGIEALKVKPDGSQILLSLCNEFKQLDNYGTTCSQKAYIWYDTLTGEKLFEINFPISNTWSSYAITDDWSTFAYLADDNESETANQPVIRMMDLATHEIRAVASYGEQQYEYSFVMYVGELFFSHDGRKLMIKGLPDYQSLMYDVYDVTDLWDTTEPINPYTSNDETLYLIPPSGNFFSEQPILAPAGRYMFFISDTRLFRYDLLESEIPIASIRADLNQGYSHTYRLSGTEPTVFSPDGTTLYIRYVGNIVMAYNTETLSKIDEMAYYQNDAAEEFQFTNDGSQVVIHAGSYQNGIPDIWAIDTDPPTRTSFLPDGITAPANHFALSPDGTQIAYQLSDTYDVPNHLYSTQIGYLLSGTYDVPNHLRIQNREDNQTVQLASRPKLLDLRFLNNGTLVGIAANSELMRWSVDIFGSDNTSPQRNEIALTGINEHVSAFTNAHHIITDDTGQWFAAVACQSSTTCERNLFKIWDVQSEAIIATVADDEFHQFGSLAFSPDSQLFAYGYCAEPFESPSVVAVCNTGEVRFYAMNSFVTDADTSEPLLTLTGFTDLPANIAFHPIQQSDGSWLVAITEWNTRTQLWRVHEDGTAEVLRTLDTVGQPVAFDPTGGLMFTTADTLQTEVWGVPFVETASTQ
jgi:WD40 repeat protein